jgi:EipB-like
MMLKRGIPAFAMTMSIAVAAHDSMAAPALFSYDATYTVTLASGSLTTGPRAASGLLDYRFSESCEGWQTRSRVIMDLTFRDGSMLVNTRDFESFESKDGRDYTFTVRTTKGDVPVEAFRGTANIPARGSGTVIYEIPNDDPALAPRKLTVTLPKGTLLPVQHNLALLDRATKGDRQFRSVIFNGASSVGPRAMSTVIGPQLAPVAPPNLVALPQIDKEMLDAPAWDLNLAFYNLIERRDTPSFEVFQRYYASGIAPAFEQQFTDFTINAELDRLQRLPAPTCPVTAPRNKN